MACLARPAGCIFEGMWTSFFDEMEKIAVSFGLAAFRQARKGRRSIRVHNLLKKQQHHRVSRVDHLYQPPTHKTSGFGVTSAKDVEHEAGQGMQETIG